MNVKTKITNNQVFQFASSIVRNKVFLYTTLIVVIFAFIASNFIFVYQNKYNTEQILYVLKDPSHIRIKIGEKHLGLSNQDYVNISYGIWAVISTVVAATGLAVAGLVAQSLTRNPLADASTLGFIQGGIFALLIALSFGWSEYYLKYIAVIIGIAISAILLIIVIAIGKSRMTATKVILAGLAMGIIFKTLSFLIRKGDKFLSSISYNYTLGGAESVNKTIGANQWEVLYISSGLIIGGLIIYALISRALTILELGDDKAKQLGIKIKTTKVVSVALLIILIPAAVLLVGNLAFVGLFSVHISRYLFKTRSYTKLLIPSIFVGVIMSLFGLLLTDFFPKVNSGIWMTLIGAPYIIYSGLRGLK